MLLCGSDLLESFSKPGVWIPDQSKEEVEPEEVLGRITAACARLVQGTRQALAPCPGGRGFQCRAGTAVRVPGQALSWALAISQDGCHATSGNNRRWRSCTEVTGWCSAAWSPCRQEMPLVGGVCAWR
uniref:Uncharacterized protein n=1 Tax=Triticum urartu TaxID=4572 RepID=A0A8R7TNA4_TRIUA